MLSKSSSSFTVLSSLNWGLALFIICFYLAMAALLISVPFLTSGAIVVAIIVFITCFVNTEAGIYILILSMLLSPEFGGGGLGGGSSTTASRGVTIRAEDLLLVILGFAWLVRMAVHKELGLIRQTPLNRPIGHYTLICLFATGMGMIWGHVNGMTGFFYVLKYIEYFVVYFIVANYVRSYTQIRRFTTVMLVTAFIVGIIAVLQIPSGQRVSAPFEGEKGEPNTLGGYLLLVGAITAGLAFQIKDVGPRRMLIALLAFLIVPFLATLSRGSYLALPFVYMALVALTPKKRVVMILAMIGVGTIGWVVMPSVVKERIMYTFNQRSTSERVQVGNVKLDTSTSERLNSWKEVGEDIVESPIWGFGVTGYGFMDAQYPRVVAETGILGLVTFLLLVGAVFREALAVFRRSQVPLYRGLAMGLVAGLTGFMVHSIGANTFIIVRVMEPFWLVVDMVISSAKIEGGETA